MLGKRDQGVEVLTGRRAYDLIGQTRYLTLSGGSVLILAKTMARERCFRPEGYVGSHA